jgi:hypothetical protein
MKSRLKEMLSGKFVPGDTIEVTVEQGKFIFKN